MKSIITITILIILNASNVQAYEFIFSNSGSPVSWAETEIDIYLDPSLENIAPAEKIYPVVEDAILVWTDYIDEEITVNFIYNDCQNQPVNCISYGSCEGHLGVTLWAYNGDNQIYEADIVIDNTVEWGLSEENTNANVKRVLTHEAGHFWGMDHSTDTDSIMYPTYISNNDQLSMDDIAGIENLYGSEITEFPEEKGPTRNKRLYMPACSFAEGSSVVKSLLSLIF